MVSPRTSSLVQGPRPGPMAASLAMLTMAPLWRGIMSALRRSRLRKKGACRLTAVARTQRLGLSSHSGPKSKTTALLTSTATGPQASWACWTSRSQASYSERSPAMAVISPPAARISSTVVLREPARGWVPSSRVRAVMTILAPSATNIVAMSLPMPRLAPVMMATLLSRML